MTTSLPIVKTCLTCPSYLKPSEVAGVYRSSTGSAMCARYGKILSRPALSDEQNEQTQIAIAGTCDSHGKARMNGVKAPLEKTEVMLPDPKLFFTKPSSGDPSHTRVTNCQMCTNYVPSDVVRRETGWTSGLCSAKGKLILDSRAKNNAEGCDAKLFGPVRRDISDLSLLPEYEDEFALAADPIKKHFANLKAGIVDSQMYETDSPVKPEEVKRGIKAWRRIVDAEDTSRHVFLPIFDRDAIPIEDQVKIPMIGDEEAPELYIDHGNLVYSIAALWTEMDETPAAWGEPGVGKTELYRHLAWLMGLPFIRISITRSSELDDLAGKSTYSPEDGTSFKPGRVVTGWSSKCVLCIDEPNTGPPDVWQFLRPLTDNSKQLVLDMDEGQTVPRNDDCFLGLAMNPDWDPRNRGAEPIADADGSRLVHVWVSMPPKELEKEIIRARVARDGWDISPKQLNTVMNIAEELRKLSADGELAISWGIRSQIKVARMLRWFGLLKSYMLASGDYLEPAQRQIMTDIVNAHSI